MSVGFLTFFQFIFLLCLSPIFSGWIKWNKSLLQNRKPLSLFQPCRDLIKLFKKQVILPQTTSWIFRLTPYVIFTSFCFVSVVLPCFSVQTFFLSLGDVIVVVGIFALARFFLALAAMDVGTAFGGFGASREMMIASLAEPSLLLIFFTLAMTANSTNLAFIFSFLENHAIFSHPSFLFIILGLFMITIAEAGRIPIDNPATHLELTMTHEAMILEYSGRYLALIEWSAQLKLLIYSVLIVNILFPLRLMAFTGYSMVLVTSGMLILKLMLLGVALAVTETALAKLRLFKAPYFLGLAFLLCLLALLTHIVFE